MRCYFEINEETDDSKTIKELIEKTDWREVTLPRANDCSVKKSKVNFFNIIHKEDDELAFSNMFEYFFKEYREWFTEFLKSELDIELENNFEIEREYNRIDLFISNDTTRIIIENKIKSGINGIKKEKGESQLSKYIDSIIEDDTNSSDNRQAVAESLKCIILKPEYVDLNRYKEYLSYNYNKNGVNKKFEYKEVSYKAIYDFYKEKINEVAPDDKLFFTLFIEAMEKHTKKTDTDIEDRMKARFIRGIEKAQKSSSIDSL